MSRAVLQNQNQQILNICDFVKCIFVVPLNFRYDLYRRQNAVCRENILQIIDSSSCIVSLEVCIMFICIGIFCFFVEIVQYCEVSVLVQCCTCVKCAPKTEKKTAATTAAHTVKYARAQDEKRIVTVVV